MSQQTRTSDDPPHHPPALVLADRYLVYEVIGRGGMASVHRGQDRRLDRPVAVKLLHAHLADDDRVLDRFRREALHAAQLNHPGVVAVYDHWKGDEADPPYIVMELVEGGSVRDVLAARGRLTPGQALALLRPALVGLADAHRSGIVHRDVTPANVLVTTDGASKLGDFGLARVAAASTATFPDGVVGSPHYMSPEAVRGDRLDPRADVYAMGCVLLECLTGRPPFDGDSPQSIALRHGVDPVPLPSSRVPDLAPAIDDVVARATAIEPGERYPDAAALVRALDDAVPEGPEAIDLRDGGSDLVVPPGHATSMLDDEPLTIAIPEDRPPRRPGWRWPVLAAVVVALLGAGGWLAWDLVVAPVTTVPAVAGQQLDSAREVLETAGFEVAVDDERPTSRTVPAGAVVTQAPTGEARRGATVELTVSAGPRSALVPPLVGLTADEARTTIAGLGLELAVTTVESHDDDAPAGTVLASTPAAGATVEEGGAVELAVSLGPAPVTVPDVSGEGRADAAAALVDAGLDPVVVDQRHDDALPRGAVLETRPAAGAEARRGDEVGLVLSSGPAPVEVPDVGGLAEEDAVATLEALGFEVEVEYVDRLLPIGIGSVDDQAPSPGQVRLRGSTVRLFVWRLL